MIAAELNELEPLAVTNVNTVHLPLGLLGFENIKHYTLLSDPGEAPFLWMQVKDDPGLAFLVVSPFEVMPDYQPDISPEDVKFIGLTDPDDALIYNIVTLRPGGRATMNLKGPVVVHRHTLRGKQVVLANAADLSLHHTLPIAE